MAVGSLIDAVNRQGPVETSRFPGWILRVGFLPIGGLVLVARRKSDGRELRYEDLCDPANYRDFNATLQSLMDRLGQEFLDLVPIESTPNEGN